MELEAVDGQTQPSWRDDKEKRSKGWVGASRRKGKGLPCGLGDHQKASLTGGGLGSECMGNRMKASGTESREGGGEWTQVMLSFRVQGKRLRFLFQVRWEACGGFGLAWRDLCFQRFVDAGCCMPMAYRGSQVDR